MSLNALCQRCHVQHSHWLIKQAEFTVGTVQNWKMQMCDPCQKAVEAALIKALRQAPMSAPVEESGP